MEKKLYELEHHFNPMMLLPIILAIALIIKLYCVYHENKGKDKYQLRCTISQGVKTFYIYRRILSFHVKTNNQINYHNEAYAQIRCDKLNGR